MSNEVSTVKDGSNLDFDRIMVRLSDWPDLTLSPGDKVVRERTVNRGRFHQKAVVVKETPKRVLIEEIWKDKRTGQMTTKQVYVERWYLYRHNWQT
jgi:hypothetical protein